VRGPQPGSPAGVLDSLRRKLDSLRYADQGTSQVSGG